MFIHIKADKVTRNERLYYFTDKHVCESIVPSTWKENMFVDVNLNSFVFIALPTLIEASSFIRLFRSFDCLSGSDFLQEEKSWRVKSKRNYLKLSKFFLTFTLGVFLGNDVIRLIEYDNYVKHNLKDASKNIFIGI